MTLAAGHVYVAQDAGQVVLKFVGHIRYTFQQQHGIGPALDAFLESLFQDDAFQDALIDLTLAESIDSTSLGLLVKLALYMEKEFGRLPTILSTNPNITETLEESGLSEAFIILKDAAAPERELERLPDLEAAERDASRAVLQAHKRLAALSQRNAELFRDVIEVLEQGPLASRQDL